MVLLLKMFVFFFVYFREFSGKCGIFWKNMGFIWKNTGFVWKNTGNFRERKFKENSNAVFFGKNMEIYEKAIRNRDCNNLYKKTPRTISSLEMVDVAEVRLFLREITMNTLQAPKVRVRTNEGKLRVYFLRNKIF